MLYSSVLVLAGGTVAVDSVTSAGATKFSAERANLVTAVAPRLPRTDSVNRPTLRQGSRGSWVKVVQRKLHVPVDGIFGPVTQDAVVDFQRRRGLSVDGIVGPQTWAALDKKPGSDSGSESDKPKARGAVAAVTYARAQVGDSYAYGAEGPGAFDCSGLTMMAWRQAGVSLPHSSSAQAQHGTPVSWSQLRPGDLIFTYKPISHVGIYVGGRRMVAASNPTDGVELIKLGTYWRQHFTAARRISG